MAGAGYKLFVTGDVLTAAQVNTYLQEQTVMSFADAAARTSALSGVLSEGMMSYLRDTNAVQVYNGSAWVAVGSSSPLTTKGDLYGFSTLDARIPIGTNNQVLTADSAQALGLKWATPTAAGKSFSLINSPSGTTLTGAATVTVSSLSGYDSYLVIFSAASSASAGSDICLRINGDTASNYGYYGWRVENNPTWSNVIINPVGTAAAQLVEVGTMAGVANSVVYGGVTISGANTSGAYKILDVTGGGDIGTGGNYNKLAVWKGWWKNTATVTSISAFSTAGNFDGGTMFIYGSA